MYIDEYKPDKFCELMLTINPPHGAQPTKDTMTPHDALQSAIIHAVSSDGVIERSMLLKQLYRDNNVSHDDSGRAIEFLLRSRALEQRTARSGWTTYRIPGQRIAAPPVRNWLAPKAVAHG
jgi:hypothetical protein